jgi:sulfite exporter TauE/SafE
MAPEKKTTITVKGMHCDACDILIKKKFLEEDNVVQVCPNHADQTVEITHKGTLNKSALNRKISQYGYSISEHNKALKQEPFIKKAGEATAIALLLLIAYYFAQELRLTSFLGVSGQMNYGTVFLLGFIASLSTCMATSGALFLSTVGKLKKTSASFRENIVPAISFNIGRVLSYAVFGFIVGAVGNSLVSSLNGGAILNIFIAVILFIIGLDMLKLFSLSSFTRIPFTKGLFSYLEERLSKNPKRTAFILGAITYLLPCGFTQTVQLYALGLANPWLSALTMMSFALGTVPVLLMFGFAASFLQSNIYKQIAKVSAVVIVLVSLSYFSNALRLYGFTLPGLDSISAKEKAVTNVLMKDGYQIATMNANARGYYPNTFTIKQGVPVRWVVKGENIYGCQGELVAPKIAVQKILATGENVIEFTPKEKGLISFSCTMGMFQGRFNVI